MIKFLALFGICCVFVQGMSISDSERTDNRSFLSLMKALRGRLEARFQGLGQKVKPDSGDDDPSNIGECFPNPCQNMGICIPGLSSYRCNCINPVYTGKNCEYIGCFSIPWPSFLSFLPQPFTTDCPTSGEICALGATFRPECVCEDSLNCPSTK